MGWMQWSYDEYEKQGGDKMKRVMVGIILFVLVLAAPGLSQAGVGVSINIGFPPPIVFPVPPAVVVLPGTNGVYVVPDLDVDLFFWGGWWWRLWEGRWYRSNYYDRGWYFYNSVPDFYYHVDPGWRGFYRDRRWYGHRWDYGPIPQNRLQENWRRWHSNGYWERHGNWGVENYRPRPPQPPMRPQGPPPQHMRPQGPPQQNFGPPGGNGWGGGDHHGR